MIRKVLIANRGEIAVRVIRACKELGIKTVAIYSEADKDAMHTQLADEAICVGKPKSKDSYLNESNIISAAVITKCNAIHPGFGFLSENSEFAAICEECNIKFIGPTSKTIGIMGDKSRAREIMKNAGVPIIPGSNGIVKSLEHAYLEAEEIGYPVMIKAALGGGGKGIRIVHCKNDLENAYLTAKTEAKVNFGDDTIYIEKFIENPRHIEFQILGDEYGNIVHLGERDCTVQRRNQKVLEEAPSMILSENLRSEMGKAARIQVEHPITEMITSIDIVKEQIKIANGERLSFSQEDIKIKGHAIECRINAENPSKGFIPSPGRIEFLNLPGGNGIRVDTAVFTGYTIPPTYDSMIAKLIAYGNNREEAINKMLRALEEFVIEGIDNNIEFQIDILNNNKFRLGDYDTSFISKEYNL